MQIFSFYTRVDIRNKQWCEYNLLSSSLLYYLSVSIMSESLWMWESLESHNSSNAINQIMENIAETATALVSALEVTTGSVKEFFSSRVVNMKQLAKDYTDKVIFYYLQLKQHLKDLAAAVVQHKQQLDTTVYTSLQSLKEQLEHYMNGDASMVRNYGFAFNGLFALIQKVMGNLRVA